MAGNDSPSGIASPTMDPSNDASATRPSSDRGVAPRPAAARARAARPALVALARERLRSTTGGRISALAGALVAIIFGVIAIGLRAGDGPDAPLGGLLATATRWIAWAAGVPLALAAAHDRASADRADGIEALAATRGIPRGALSAVRTAVAMMQAVLAIGAPVVVLSLLTVAIAGSVPAAVRHAALAAALAVFCTVAGVTIGGIASACGRIGGPRGRSLLAAVFLVPWVLSDLAGYRAWSIPGALDAALTFAVRAAGAGGTGV